MKMSPVSNACFDNGAKLLNVSTRKVGGLRFIKIGRFCVSFCVTQNYRSL